MDNGFAVLVLDDEEFERLAVAARTDEHGNRRIVGGECSPMVPECMEHVFVVDPVLAGARIDVHRSERYRIGEQIVNRC